METLTEIITHIQNYMTSLDWSYILTFILICYGLNHNQVKRSIGSATGRQTRTRYRVVLIGLLYGATLFFTRGYKLAQVENLLQSFIFALVFHKMVIEAIIYWLVRKGLPESISKHLIDEEQIKKIQNEKR